MVLTLHLPMDMEGSGRLLQLAARIWPNAVVGVDDEGNMTVIADPLAVASLEGEPATPAPAATGGPT